MTIRAHQPITGLHFVDWQLICMLGHAHYLCRAHIMIRVRAMVKDRLRLSCHVTCADSAKICCISNIWSVCKNNLIQQNLLCQQKCMATTRQKMLYKQIFAVSAKISWFSRNTLCQQTCCWVSKLPGDVTTTKMLSKQKFAKIRWSSAVLAKFDESSLTQQLTSTTDYDCTLSPSFLFLVTPLATQCWLWLVFYSFCIANLMALWYVIYFRF